MDIKNPVEPPVMFTLHRTEHLVAFAVTIVLVLVYFTEICWVVAIGLCLCIDHFGCIPGAIAHRRSENGCIPKFSYVLYDSMHSLISVAAVGALWMWLAGPELALLALALHVFGGHGVFGNLLKPFGLPVEPFSAPQIDKVTALLKRRATTGPVPLPLTGERGSTVLGAHR